MNETILRLPAVQCRTGLCRSTIYLRVHQGTFPGPVRLGGRSVGWLSSEVDAWITELIEARQTRLPPGVAGKPPRVVPYERRALT